MCMTFEHDLAILEQLSIYFYFVVESDMFAVRLLDVISSMSIYFIDYANR